MAGWAGPSNSTSKGITASPAARSMRLSIPLKVHKQPLPVCCRQHSHLLASSSGRAVQSLHRNRRPCTQTQASQPPTPQPDNSGLTPVPKNQQPTAFGSLEQRIVDNLSIQALPGSREDWCPVEGCWVLGPPAGSGPPQAIIEFIGGAFVGAAPQLSYRLLLESLAAKGILVIAAPFPTGFNHSSIADLLHYKLERCKKALGRSDLPVYGMGHSLGSLLHLLIATQYPVQRAGSILMSFNNKDVLESIPFFAPFLGPGARALGPVLSQLAASPFRSQLEAPLEALRRLSPDLVQQFMPILDQLLPVALEVANGRQEFTPPPSESRRLIRSYYSVPRNLLIQFEDDKIDETSALASVLSSGSAVSAGLDMTVKVLPGDHIQPLQQNIGSLPPELAAAVSQGNSLLEQLASQTQGPVGSQFREFAKGLSGLANNVAGGGVAANVAAIQLLADNVHEWIQTQPMQTSPRGLPPVATSPY